MTSTLWSFQKQVCGTPVGDKAAIMAGQSKFDVSDNESEKGKKACIKRKRFFVDETEEDSPASKKKPGSSSKPQKVGKAERRCRGCTKVKKSEFFAMNQVLCHECKRTTDCLYKICKRQQCSDWFLEVKGDDARYAQLISVFARNQAASSGSKKKTAKFNALTYRQTYENITAVVKEEVGQMMDKDQFVDFQITVKKQPVAKAVAMWEQMLLKQNEFVTDHDEDDNIRFRVITKNLVKVQEVTRHKKTLELEVSRSKKVTDEMIDQGMMACQSGHAEFGGSNFDVMDIAKSMAKQGPMEMDGDFFGGFDAGMVDVKKLVEQPLTPMQLEDSDSDDQQEAGNDAPSKTVQNKGKKGQFLDVETEILKAKRTWLQGIEKLKADVLGQIADSSILLLEVSKHATSDAAHYRNPYDLLRARLIVAKLMNCPLLGNLICSLSKGEDNAYNKYLEYLPS